MVKLRRGLIVRGAPGRPAVERDDRALGRREQHDVGIPGVDPDTVIVVASRCAAQRAERPAAIGRLPRDNTAREDDVGVRGMDPHLGDVRLAHRDSRIVVDELPAFAGIVRSVESCLPLRVDRREEALDVARRDCHADAREPVVVERRKTFVDGPPGGATIVRLEDAGATTAKVRVLPGCLPRFPQHGVHNVRVLGVEREIRGAGVGPLVEHLLERSSPVARSEDATLLVCPVRVSEHRHPQPVRLFRVNDDLRDLLPVAKTETRPGVTGVGGLDEAVAGSDVDHIRVGGRYCDRTDRSRGLVVEDRVPRAAGVGRLPDAAIHDANIEDMWLIGNAGCGRRASTAMRSDHAVSHLTTTDRHEIGRH